MTIPPVPTIPATRSLSYEDPADVNTYAEAWRARDAAQTAEIARLTALIPPAPAPVPVGPAAPVFSWDTSALGNDAKLSDAQRISSHKTMYATPSIQNVRVFFGSSVPNWTDPRIVALGPDDSFILSSLSTDFAAVAAFLKATPDKFRSRPGQVKYAFGHEREADLDVGAGLKAWLDGNARLADTLNNAVGYSTDDLIKITLWYSQQQDKRAGVTIPNREQMYGGQDFGIFGEDVYNPRAASRYFSAVELFGPIVDFCAQIGRPLHIAEWGGERLTTDTDGTGRTKMITDGAAYLRSAATSKKVAFINGSGANYWCADGMRSGVRVLHHLDETGSNSPEVKAYAALIAGK